MKKTFRSILAGALALLAVSCYDDSDLRKQIADIDDRVVAIENTLNDEQYGIDYLLSKIDELSGKIAAIKVETDASGVTTVTLSNDSKIVLAPQNGVLTVEDNTWYAFDQVTGVKTAVGQVGDDVTFKVVNGELMYVASKDAEAVATGVKVTGYTAHVIGNAEVAEDGKSITVVVGDQTLELPLVTDAVAALGLSRDSFYLYYGAEKTVEITAEGLNEIYVMNEPDGWRANIVDGALVVKAPTEKAVAADAAEAEGLVLVHATTEEGKCIVAKLEVSTGKALSVTLDSNGMFTIKNAVAEYNADYDETDFGNFFVSFITPEMQAELDSYGMTFDEYYKQVKEPFGMSAFFYNNYYAQNEDASRYQEGVYEVDEITMSFDQLGYTLFWQNIPTGAWTIYFGMTDSSNELIGESIAINYVNAKVEAQPVEVSHNEITFTAMSDGSTDKFFVGAIAQSDYTNAGWTFDDYMQSSDQMARGLWYEFKNGYVWAMGNIMTAEQLAMGVKVTDLFWRPDPLAFDAAYDVWVMPLYDNLFVPTGETDVDGLPVYDVTAMDYYVNLKPYVYTFKTNPLVNGEVAAPTIEENVTYKRIQATVTPAEGTSLYYMFMTSRDFDNYKTDAELFDAVLKDCNWAEDGTFKPYEDVSQGETRILVLVAVSEDGKYKIYNHTITALKYPTTVSEDLTLEFADPVIGYTNISVALTPAEGAKLYYTFMTDEEVAQYTSTDAVLIDRFLKNYNPQTTYTASKTVAQGAKTTLVALVVNGDNYKVYKQSYTAKSYPYNESVKVTLDSATKADDGTYTVIFNVEGGANKLAWMETLYSASSIPTYLSQLDGYLVASSTNAKYVDVVEGKATIVHKNTKAGLYVTAYKSEDGVVTAMAPKENAYANQWTKLIAQ